VIALARALCGAAEDPDFPPLPPKCLGRIEQLLLIASAGRATLPGHVANLTGGF
jgi:hypothetical protein